jgi:hypothetical protein
MVNVAPSLEKQPSKNEDKTLSQGYGSVATATSNSRKPRCRMEVRTRSFPNGPYGIPRNPPLS